MPSNGNHNSNFIGQIINKKTLKIVKLELLMLPFGILMNILETDPDWSLLLLQIEFTLQQLKLCIWRWDVLQLDLQEQEKLKPQKICLLLWQKLFMCLTAHLKWTMNQWVIFTRDLLRQVAGDALINLIDYFLKYFQYALCNLNPLLMLLRLKNKNSFFKAIKFLLIQHVVFSSQWIQGIWVALNYLKVSRHFLGLLPLWFLIYNWYAKICWWPKVSLMQKCWQRNLLLCICCAEIYFQNSFIMIGD